MKFSINAALALASAVCLLSACGGSNNTPTTPEPVKPAPTGLTVTGVASKGLLRGALVSAHALTPEGPQSQPLATAVTDDQGRYLLTVPAGTGPILLKAESVPGQTRMLDESQHWQSEFRTMAAPAGLVLRAIANTSMAGSQLQVNITPWSEGATEVAARLKNSQGQSLAWTSSALAAGQQWALQMAPAGVDPLTDTPTGLAAVSGNSAAQNKMLVQLMGFMSDAAGCVNDGNSLTGQDVLCALQALRETTSATLEGNNIRFEQAARMQDLRYRWQLAAVPAAIGTGLQNLAKTDLEALRAATGTAQVLSLPQASSELERFVKGLREGFRATESTLDETDAALQRRYTELTSTGAEAVLDATRYIDNECQIVNDQLRCGSFWSAIDGGFERLGPSPDVLGGRLTTRLTVSGDKSSGYKARYSADQTLNGRTLSSAAFDIHVKGVDESGRLIGKSAELQINGVFTAWEDKDPGKWAKVEIQRLDLRGTDDTLESLDLAGEILVSSSFGDRLSGSLEISAQRNRNSLNDESHIRLLMARLRADVTPLGSPQFASLTLIGSATPREYSSLGYGTYSLQALVELTSRTRMTLSLSKSAAKLATAMASVASDGYELIMSVEASASSGRYCLAGDEADLCSNLMRVSTRDGRFTAVVDGTTLSGDIFYEGQKIGRINRNSVTINGQEFSLY